MLKQIFFIKKVIILGGLLVFGIWMFGKLIHDTGIDNILSAVSSVNIWYFLLFLFLSQLNMFIYTLRWDIVLHHHHQAERIPFFRLFLHRIAAYAVSYITPAAMTGGEPVRIYFLQKDNVPTEYAVSSTVIDKVLELSALLLLIAAGVIFALLDGSFPGQRGTFLFVSLGVLFALIFWFYYSIISDIGFLSAFLRGLELTRFKKIKKLEQRVRLIERQMAKFYKGHLAKFSLLVFLSLLTLGFMVFEHWLIAQCMGFDLTLKQSFLAGTIPGISYLVPIPGALGALEQSHAVIFTLMGVGINAFVFVLLMRIRDLIWVFAGLAHASTFGIKIIRETLWGTPANSSEKK